MGRDTSVISPRRRVPEYHLNYTLVPINFALSGIAESRGIFGNIYDLFYVSYFLFYLLSRIVAYMGVYTIKLKWCTSGPRAPNITKHK